LERSDSKSDVPNIQMTNKIFACRFAPRSALRFAHRRLWVGWVERGVEEVAAWDKGMAMMGHDMVPHGMPAASHVGNLRVRTLENLTLTQIVIIIAAWKIEERNLRREDYIRGVTFIDVETEVEEYKRTRSSAPRSTPRSLFSAFLGLLDLGLVKFADRHLGAAPLMYSHVELPNEGSYEGLKGRRIHVPVEWREEGKEWIRRGGRATTGVREWALKG